MFLKLGRAESGCIEEAASACQMEFGRDDTAYSNHPYDPPGPLAVRHRLGRPDRVLRLTESFAAMQTRKPSEAGIYILGCDYYLTWDAERDGFGLNAFVGPAGERLKAAYTEALCDFYLKPVCDRVDKRVDAAGDLHLEYTMAAKTIRVRIAKADGAVRVETEGFVGDECKLATEEFVKSVGGAATDVPTPEAFESVSQEVPTEVGT